MRQVLSDHDTCWCCPVSIHRHGQNQGRECPKCGSAWTIEFYQEGTPYAWKGNDQAQHAILDWTGNNVAVQCCEFEPSDKFDGRR